MSREKDSDYNKFAKLNRRAKDTTSKLYHKHSLTTHNHNYYVHDP